MTNTKDVTLEMEVDNADLAFQEFDQTGSTTRRCLKCGGEFHFEDFQTAYRVTCVKEGRVIFTSRGL